MTDKDKSHFDAHSGKDDELERIADVDVIRERLALALDAGRIGTWHANLRDNTLEWSSLAREYLGIPGDVPASYELFIECIHPEDRDRIPKLGEYALATLGGLELRVSNPSA